MSNSFFTSDLHFNHFGVIGYCNRPWPTVPEMNEGLIANWNSVVGPRDRIFVMGDFHLGGNKNLKEIVSRLNGHKILFRGNHDAPAKLMVEAGFDRIEENEVIKLPDGTKVFGSHFPYYPTLDDRAAAIIAGVEMDTRYLHKRIWRRDQDMWLIHGHVHQAWQVFDRQLNVGVDVWDYKPVPVETLIKIIKETT